MPKRRLYAQLSAALFWLWCCGDAAGAQPPAANPPCGACISITITAGQSLLLPEELAGLTVLVRVEGRLDAPVLTAALEEIRRRGGRAGFAFVRTEQDVGSIDQFVFEL